MMTKLGCRKRCHTAKTIAFLFTLALIATVMGCVEGTGFEYNLTISSTAGGSVKTPGEGSFTYDYGEAVALVAQAQTGYRFVNWTGNVGTVEDVEAPSTTITMRADYSVTASFEAAPGLTISSTTGGSVTAPGEGVFTYDPGTVVELRAVADECHQFVNWTGDVVDPQSATTTITVATSGGQSVTANFARLRYKLTTGSTAGGSVIAPGEGTFAYDCGTRVNLVASPDDGYRFAGWSGDVEGIGDTDAAEAAITMRRGLTITAGFVPDYTPMVDTRIWHTVALTSNGTVVATGWNEYGQCEVGEWRDIICVAAGEHHTVGLRSDGTAVAVGDDMYGQCNVEDWTGVVQIDAGKFHTVGLRWDGTVVAVGWNTYRQCNVGNWTDIIQIAAGFYHTVGLRSDGTVVAVGPVAQNRLDVDDWTDIVQVGAGGHQSIGLKSDGTVLAVGRNYYGECDVDDWTDIVQVAGGCQVTIGLRSDGSVVARGWNDFWQCDVSDWSDIVQVMGGMGHTIGLRSDGTVVAAGRNHYGQRDVGEWMLG